MWRSNHCSTVEIFNVILLDVTTAKHVIIPTERETKEGGIMEDGTNREGHWVAAKGRELEWW